ncbi:MAG: peptide chain release factor N(5)-glutamine methyltransferase [Bradyrhizobium sp.]|uniref:peptide chain release factor N(5)-glutamine methyltransferase n=1 Tax=Bradyrhizobium sp. TaxID=376 RepID=UPI003D0D8A9C
MSAAALAGRPTDAARRALAKRFESAGIDSPELDARLLVGHVLGLDLTGMIASSDRPLTADESMRLDVLSGRRLAGEPVARILGQKEFWGLPLALSPETLVPRPDTETVVELALEMLRESPAKNSPSIADLGTGTGAILLALLSELPDATGIGTDISVEALGTATANAAHLGLALRANFIHCDFASALTGPFDLVVSNPPYIRTGDIANLAVEVRAHDPLKALDGGADGLDAYRILIPQAARILRPCGALVVEAGKEQAVQIEGLMTAAGLMPHASPKADLGGIPRAVGARKMP